MTTESMKQVIMENVPFSELSKNKGIYEFFEPGDNNPGFKPKNMSLGISYEDADDEKDVYVYNIFIGEEYINISGRGSKENPLPDDVLSELVETWNSLEAKNDLV